MFSVSVNGDRGEGRVKSSGLDTFWNNIGGILVKRGNFNRFKNFEYMGMKSRHKI